MTQQKQNGNLVAIITMFFIFAMISFVTNLAAPFGTIWRNEYAGSNTLGMMGNMMNFLAYLFMGIPAGNMLVKIGYKKTALIAMAVGFLGLFTQYLSSIRSKCRSFRIRRICYQIKFRYLSAWCIHLRFLCLYA